MSEGMSEARLAEIRNVYVDDHDAIGELLAEVERLHAQLAEQARLAAIYKAQSKMAADRLAEIGETSEEWAAPGPAGWMQWPGELSERYAREIVGNAAKRGVRIPLKRRLAGEWREVKQEAEGG
jgi:hypothetical protein